MLHSSSRPSRPSRLPLLAVGALLAAPLLGGCGFEYQTDRVNTIGAGVNDRAGTVDVLGSVIIAGEDDAGVFAANLVNKSTTEEITFDGLQPTDQVQPADPEVGLELPASGMLNLFGEDAVAVEGDFTAGDFVPVTLEFSNGQVTTLTIPVVTPCRQYSPEVLPDITLPGGEPSDIPGDENAEVDDTDGLPGKYSCEYASPIPEGSETEEPADGAEEGGQ
ncbi:hypothetical protein [Nocardioides litoris]|uniref:hypothetical protein n=1 Tax=Nocardioides litoris TaxID=1926648 RepID=UPI00111ECEE1|nr:hypothetical protein [Nocardioides litoris]